MKITQILKYCIALVFCSSLLSCSNDNKTLAPETLNAQQLKALNATDMKILENCSQAIQNTEGANCCVVIPDSISKSGTYLGGAKYIVNAGQGPFEPNGLTYEWQVEGHGIIIVDGIDEPIAMFEFTKDFVNGVIKASVRASDGSERCIAIDTVFLK